MQKQALNPYLPSWEYIPDGEPYVFGDRVYVYGSHDFFNGHVFCMGDYMGWSAPVDDLSAWRCEGVIYPRNADPLNHDGKMCLYAPDVCRGADGRYYLYYVLDKAAVVSVAVCDTPAGRYEFLGYVHDVSGARLGERAGDEMQFDPGVLVEDGRVYLYTGFCPRGESSRHGAMVTVLADDMLTICEEPRIVVPGCEYEQGTGFEGHAYFEAASIRKREGKYYFIYSSTVMHELCYAVSDSPVGGFRYGGVIVSNCDVGIDSYKSADMPTAFGNNNHGSIVEIAGQWYIFYHRHTHGTSFSRQGCAEMIAFEKDGAIRQVEMTSCGLNGAPLKAEGEYPAYIACNLFTRERNIYNFNPALPRITQDGRDGDELSGYVANITDGTTIGFKYFACHGVQKLAITTRGYIKGAFEIRNRWDGDVLAKLPVDFSNVWEESMAAVHFPDGKQALYLTFCGSGSGALGSIRFE